MAWNYLLFLVYLMYLSTGCNGVIVLEPEHRIGKEGQNTIFTFKSNATGKPLKWLYSPVGQKETYTVYYNGTYVEPTFDKKMIVNQSEIDGMLYSTLEIKNSALADAGIISSQDDAPYGRTADAIFSVTQDIKCIAACIEDSLWVQCNTCYRSDELLELVLNHTALIPAKENHRMNDTEKGCVQIESYWILKMPCYSIPESHITVMLWGDKTHTNISSHSIRILTDKSSNTTTIKTTESDSNLPENETCHGEQIGLAVLGTVTAIMGIAIIILTVCMVCMCRRKRQPPKISVTYSKGSSNNPPPSSNELLSRRE